MQTVIILSGILSFLISAFLAIYVLYRSPKNTTARNFSLLMCASACYSAFYSLEINSPDIQVALVWLKLNAIAVSLVPVYWYLFVRSYIGSSGQKKSFSFFAIFLIPAVSIILAWTNESHGIIYSRLWLKEGLELSIIQSTKNWWFWVFTIYMYFLLGFGSVRLFVHIKRSSGLYRRQSILLILGVCMPWISHILLILGLSPYNLDTTPFMLSVSGVFFSIGIFKMYLFDLVPIARDRVVDAIGEGVVVLDRKSRFIDANKAALEIFPALSAYKPGMDITPFFDALEYTIPGGSGSVELDVNESGINRRFRFTATRISDDEENHIGSALILTDITETHVLMEKLEKLATIDELSGALNRRHFIELALRELERAKRTGSPLSLLMFDLDHFKRINDQNGHAAGDTVIISICGACRSLLRFSDLFCRYGGEEFIIMLPDTDAEAAEEIAERLRKTIWSLEIEHEQKRIKVSASFGVISCDDLVNGTLDYFLIRVDEALYMAKESGRNKVIRLPSLGTKTNGTQLQFSI